MLIAGRDRSVVRSRMLVARVRRTGGVMNKVDDDYEHSWSLGPHHSIYI